MLDHRSIARFRNQDRLHASAGIFKSGHAGPKRVFFRSERKNPSRHWALRIRSTDVVFGEDDFERFARELAEIGSGAASRARLVNVGEMFVLSLVSRGRELHCSINIREFQPGTEQTTLTAAFKVDYDLFVNKLADDMREFAMLLKNVVPESAV